MVCTDYNSYSHLFSFPPERCLAPPAPAPAPSPVLPPPCHCPAPCQSLLQTCSCSWTLFGSLLSNMFIQQVLAIWDCIVLILFDLCKVYFEGLTIPHHICTEKFWFFGKNLLFCACSVHFILKSRHVAPLLVDNFSRPVNKSQGGVFPWCEGVFKVTREFFNCYRGISSLHSMGYNTCGCKDCQVICIVQVQCNTVVIKLVYKKRRDFTLIVY